MSTEEQDRKKLMEQIRASTAKPERIIEQARAAGALDKPRRGIQPIRDNRVIEKILDRLTAVERRIAELETAVQGLGRSR